MTKITNEINSFKSKLLVSMIIIYPSLLVFQGLDFTDTGFYLTSYVQIFNSPRNLRYELLYWLSDVIGGIWLRFFGGLGYIGIRLAWVLIIWIIIFCYYKLLCKYINKNILLTGLFIMLIFTSNTTHTLDYNTLTTLFYGIGSISLFYGVTNNKNYLILLGAFVLGLGIFLRLPNVLGMGLVLGIFYYGLIEKITFRNQLRQCLYFAIGYILAIVFTIILMKLLGHLNYYIDSLKLVIGLGSNSKASHGIGNLIFLFISNYLNVIKLVIMFGIIIIGAIILTIPIVRKSEFPTVLYVFVFIISLMLWSRYYSFDSYKNSISAINGFTDIALILYIFNFIKTSNKFRLISLLGLLILILTPLGSDNGIYNSIFGMWLSGVILLWTIFQIDVLINFKSISLKNSLNSFKSLICIVFIAFCLVQGYRYTYRDTVNRSLMKYSINNKSLRGIFTTKDRAKVVGELLNQTKDYVKKNENLLAYSDIQLIYYLTETKPYLHTSFQRAYSDDKFIITLNEAKNEYKKLPVIIIQTTDTTNKNWPLINNKLFAKKMEESIRFKCVKNFMIKHNYKLKWSNKCFQIWRNI